MTLQIYLVVLLSRAKNGAKLQCRVQPPVFFFFSNLLGNVFGGKNTDAAPHIFKLEQNTILTRELF